MERRTTNAEKRVFRAAYIKHILDICPNSILTLGMGRPCKPEILSRKIDHFFKCIHREAYGRNWHKRDSVEGIVAIGVYEHLASNTHVHFALKAPTPFARSALDRGERIWRKIRPGAHYYYDGIKDPEKYACYITKEIWREEVRDSVYYFNRPDMRGPHRKIQ
ncbi:hypothetical protein DBR41_26530 [Pseudomonas sp. HMWF010]|nr:hypothetical protein DBR41_26530 [Pseudomonas sp. HMWF010]